MLHVVSTLCVGDSSWRSEEIVKTLEFYLSILIVLLLFLLLLLVSLIHNIYLNKAAWQIVFTDPSLRYTCWDVTWQIDFTDPSPRYTVAGMLHGKLPSQIHLQDTLCCWDITWQIVFTDPFPRYAFLVAGMLQGKLSSQIHLQQTLC